MSGDIAPGALAGIKVIDLSRVLGGPYCAQILGDHGADVIKVEPPSGDETRGWGPPFRDGTASYFEGANRNKRAIKLGTLERWGLGSDVLQAEFLRLIHCRISGFGADGPLGGLPGYDACAQGMGGLMSVNGEAGREPARVGLPVVDIVTGLNAVIGIAFGGRGRRAERPSCRRNRPGPRT